MFYLTCSMIPSVDHVSGKGAIIIENELLYRKNFKYWDMYV